MIPVNQRTRATTGGANQVSGYLCDLPIAQPDPAARLAAVRQAMHANKTTGSRQGAGAVALQPAGSSPQA